MYSFLDQKDVVVDLAPGYKFSLVFRDEVRDDLFESIGNDLGKYFVRGVAKGDRSRFFSLGIRARKMQFVALPILSLD